LEKKLGQLIGEGGMEGVERSATDKGRKGRQQTKRIREEDDDESMLPAEGSARGERKGRGDERKKKVRGILVHKI